MASKAVSQGVVGDWEAGPKKGNKAARVEEEVNVPEYIPRKSRAILEGKYKEKISEIISVTCSNQLYDSLTPCEQFTFNALGDCHLVGDCHIAITLPYIAPILPCIYPALLIATPKYRSYTQ